MTTTRGARTRERLVDAAEQLMSERGVDNVSLREIRIAAGQRNTSALQFHFGDRNGLLRAMADRHLPRLEAIQHELYERMVADDRENDVRSLVEVLVRPTAEYLREGPSARAWVRIAAQLLARPERSLRDFHDNLPVETLTSGAAIYDHLCTTLPRAVALERVLAVSQVSLHVCADRARLEDATDTGRSHLDLDGFIENLVDMAFGALTAPAKTPPRTSRATTTQSLTSS
jgi:AcrR family transcriptional regulator